MWRFHFEMQNTHLMISEPHYLVYRIHVPVIAQLQALSAQRTIKAPAS